MRHLSAYRFIYIGVVLAIGSLFAYISLITQPTPAPDIPPTPLPATNTFVPQNLPEPPAPKTFKYIMITGSCNDYSQGGCVNVRNGAGISHDVIAAARNGMVLKVQKTVQADGYTWHHVVFDEWLRYPERVEHEWYIADDFVTSFTHLGEELLSPTAKPITHKRILVDRSDQKLYAYEGSQVVFEESVSTGISVTPTPRGVFTIFRKTPSRYMQGPLPGISEKQYDLPGVPWNLYFTEEGAVIHGAYWHNNFGTAWSNGCVNLPPNKAREIYEWADVGTQVIVRD